MTKADLADLRRLAINNRISYSEHALDQMLDRDISCADVKDILSSPTNQLIETQSPSNAVGKVHSDERALVSDPLHKSAIIVVLVILFKPLPEIRVITVEPALEDRWNIHIGNDPWLIRKM